MEDSDAVISLLKAEIKSRDKDIHLAATYGKQLFEEKVKLSTNLEDLHSQKELLEQERHSLQLELETLTQTVKSQSSELEIQRDEVDKLLQKLQINEKENEAMHKRIQNLTKENQYMKKAQEDLSVENKSLQDKIHLLEKQIKNFQDQAEKSLCEVDDDQSQELQSQLNTYMLNNKELQKALSQMQYEVETAKKNENHLLTMVKDLEEAVSDRDGEIRAYSAEMKKMKEEMEELQGEIEVFKYEQVDTKKRGNSVFAELDDRRTLVEKEYKKLLKQYEQYKKNYEANKTELDMARGRMIILQSMASREYQQTYIDNLEENLTSAKREVNELTLKLSKALKCNTEVHVEDQDIPRKNEYDYLRVMLKQSQKKEKELNTEVANLRMKNMYENDKLIETQQVLYKKKEELDSAKQEISKLKLKIKEMEKGVFEKDCDDPESRKPKVDVFENFKPLTNTGKSSALKIPQLPELPDMSIIPGEIEFSEDGFRQIRPPRKSNKFILKEFNQIKEEDNEDSSVTTEKTESVQIINEELEKGVHKEIPNHKHKNRSKISSHSKYDNCAQQ